MPARNITTEIWSDPVFADLSSAAQLVFLRLVTGPETNAAGITCVLPKALAVDTNLEREQVRCALDELIGARLVRRYEEWLWMPAWVQHQVIAGGMLVAARREASRRGLPRALALAVTRALDARFGARTDSDAPRTKKVANSRASRGPSREGPDTVPGGSREGSGTYQYQYQDLLPSGGGGPSATTPAPAPGAQTPSREIDDSERQHAGAVALAEVAGEVADPDIAARLAAQVERLAASTALPDPGPPPDPEPVHTGTIDDEEVVSAAGLRAWEERSLLAWQQSGDRTALRELQRSGSVMAKAAVARLLREGQL